MHSSWGFPFEHFVADLDLEPWMTGWQTALAEGCHSDPDVRCDFYTVSW